MERNVTMVIEVPEDMLTDFRVFTVTRGGAIVDVRTEGMKAERHPIKKREEYVQLYEKRKERLEELFDSTATAEEIAGFFLYHESENALNEMRECIDQDTISGAEKEAIRILEVLKGEKDKE